MEHRVLRAHAHGQGDAWEAVCIDLDIAVQGQSFDEVRALLDEAIISYVADARRERPADARRLLGRRAPLWVRLRFVADFVVHVIWRGRRELQAGFDIPCPA